MNIRRILNLLTLSAGLVGGLGLPSQAIATQPLRLAVAPFPSMSPGTLAAVDGHFREAGSPVELVSCVNGGECASLLAEGKADLALVSDIAFVLAVMSGQPLELLGTVASSRRSNQIIRRTDRGTGTGADLRGMRLGYISNTSSHFYAEKFLRFHGLTKKEVTLVALDPRRPVEALVQGQVDAAALFPPFILQAMQQLGPRGDLLQTPAIYTLSINLVARPGLGDARLTGVLSGLRSATKAMGGQPERSRAVLAEALRMPGDQLQVALTDFDFRVSLDQSLISTLEAQSRWALRNRLTTRTDMPDYLDLIRLDPLKALDRRAVSIVK